MIRPIANLGGRPAMVASDSSTRVVGYTFAAGGNLLAWFQSADLGLVAGSITAISLALAGGYSAWTDRKIKAYIAAEAARVDAYKATERARIEMELERDSRLGPTITRKLEAALRDLDDAKHDRDELRDQLEAIRRGVHKLDRKVAARPRVLIVDDDPETCDALAKVLARKGYDSEQAHTLAEARGAVSPRFAWVLLDVVLPDGSGLDLLREIRGKSLLVKVAVMSGFGGGDALEAAHAAMADLECPKPVDVAKLINGMRALDDKAPRPHTSDLDLATIPDTNDGEG